MATIAADAPAAADSPAEVGVNHSSLRDGDVSDTNPDRSALSPTADAAGAAECSVRRSAPTLLTTESASATVSRTATSNAAALKIARRDAQRSRIEKDRPAASISTLPTAGTSSPNSAAVAAAAISRSASATAVRRILIKRRIRNCQR